MDAPDNKRKCARCDLPWSLNPITEEWTCFVHGRPDGSEWESLIWEKTKITTYVRSWNSEVAPEPGSETPPDWEHKEY